MSHEPEDDTPVDLAQWASDFHASTGGVRPPSLESILERASRDARKERLEWATQIAGTLFAFAVFLGLVVHTGSALFAGFAAFVLPTLFALFGWFVLLRVAATKHAAASLADHVAAATRRNLARYRVARASLAALVLLATGFWVWFPVFVLSKSERFAAEPWRLGVAVTASLLVFGAGAWRSAVTVKQTRAELESWRAVSASLRESPEP